MFVVSLYLCVVSFARVFVRWCLQEGSILRTYCRLRCSPVRCIFQRYVVFVSCIGIYSTLRTYGVFVIVLFGVVGFFGVVVSVLGLC